jgi:predicted short-subunit dehydrogenase-like oxidoreductase (DUF2520 family)
MGTWVMVVRVPDNPGRLSSRKLGRFPVISDWLAGQGRALYFAAAVTQAARTQPNFTRHTYTSSTTESRLVSPMRELERDSLPSALSAAPGPLVVIGDGRVGGSLVRAAELAGIDVRLARRDEPIDGGGAVLLCVPDDAIAAACARIAEADPRLVGHVSGASTLDALAAAREQGASTFSLHPLQTFADGETAVAGTPAAIAGSDEAAISYARSLAEMLGMKPFEVPEESRAAYHAAAAMASNLLVALEESAAELVERLGIEDARELLAPLVMRTAANWAERGAAALTGPIARGDHATVERHRTALTDTAPELLPLYDALAARAEAVARVSANQVSR